VRLQVARSDGTLYREPEVWFEGDIGMVADGAQLLSGDFTGDGREDAALLVGAGGTAAALLVLQRRRGTGFLAPIPWWSGDLDLAVSEAAAGDVNGDGRTDLLVREDLPEGLGVRVSSAISPATAGPLGALRIRFQDARLLAGRHTLWTVGDADRDGRDDVWLVTADAEGSARIEVLRAPQNPAWKLIRRVAWRASAGEPLSVGQLHIATGDLDYDGVTDLVTYRDGGADGTSIVVFTRPRDGAYGKLRAGPAVADPGMAWGALHPY
jgi:hypothetical protein